MSDKKEQILDELRSRYESKYGSSDALKQVITTELSKISKKKKINFEVIFSVWWPFLNNLIGS